MPSFSPCLPAHGYQPPPDLAGTTDDPFDPEINSGVPFFAGSGAPLHAVLSRLRAGERIPEVADDLEVPVDQITEVADRAGLIAA